MADVMDDPKAMERRWPGWRIRRTGRGGRMWSAVRKGKRQLTVDETSAGLAMTLLADTREELVEQLQEQHQIGWGC